MLKFDLYIGDTGKLYTNENYLNFRWRNPDCNILFSATQQGKAIPSHFTSDKPGLRKMKQALNEWCEFCFELFKECEMVIGVIKPHSVCKLAEKCGFEYVTSSGNKKLYVRRKK